MTAPVIFPFWTLLQEMHTAGVGQVLMAGGADAVLHSLLSPVGVVRAFVVDWAPAPFQRPEAEGALAPVVLQ